MIFFFSLSIVTQDSVFHLPSRTKRKYFGVHCTSSQFLYRLTQALPLLVTV